MLILWSIIAVEVIRPINEEVAKEGVYDGCERCTRAFGSVEQSCLTFVQQLLAGDSWGLVTIPIIERAPWTAIFFTAVLISVNLGMMNLILSVIVDKAQEARADDHAFLLTQRQQEFEASKKDLLKMCVMLDEDDSGTLSLEELLSGYDEFPRFSQAMQVMQVSKDDLPFFYTVLDMDGSGDLNYKEFIEQVHKIKSQDSQVLLVLVKAQLTELRNVMSANNSAICNDLKQFKASLDDIGKQRFEWQAQAEAVGAAAPDKGQECRSAFTRPEDRNNVSNVPPMRGREFQQDGNDASLEGERELQRLREQVLTEIDAYLAHGIRNFPSQDAELTQLNEARLAAVSSSPCQEEERSPQRGDGSRKRMGSIFGSEVIPRPNTSSGRRQPEGCKIPACCTVQQDDPPQLILEMKRSVG